MIKLGQTSTSVIGIFNSWLLELERLHETEIRNAFCQNWKDVLTGTVRDIEFQFIEKLCLEAKTINGPVLEIGTFWGFSTLRFNQILSSQRQTKPLITVDDYSWQIFPLDPLKQHKLVNFFLNRQNYNPVEVLSIDKNAFYESYHTTRPSLMFIDGPHTYEEVIQDLKWAKAMKVPIVAGHDYKGTHRDVRRAVDDMGGPSAVEGSVWRL